MRESQLKFSTASDYLGAFLNKSGGDSGKGEKGFAEPQALIKKQPGQKTAASAAKKEVVSRRQKRQKKKIK